VITPGGFVETAENHHDFARAIRYKLLRELVAPMSSLPHNPRTVF
jgi:Ca-activated chloride channel homolog